MRILSLDVGFKRVGVAISSFDRKLIYPVSTIKMKKFEGRIFFDNLNKILNNLWNEIDSVVIGDGLDFEWNNSISKIVSQTERILKSWTNWKIILISEVNSSCESRDFLKKLGVPAKNRKEKLDSYAALFILKEYMDSLNKKVLVGF